MLILLPPSETKRSGGNTPDRRSSLRNASELRTTREQVKAALVELSADDDTAAKVLKLGVKARSELAHNRALRDGSAAVMPAGERYTGVLYDALDIEALDSDARAWVDQHVAVQSALFGLVSAADQIPAYRLSASSRLPGLATTLKRAWRLAHASLDWSSGGWVLDLRSQDYADLAPLPNGTGASLQVAQRGDDGEVRALNHFNKAAKGDLVRRLACSAAQIESEDDLVAWGREHGLEVSWDADAKKLTLVTELGAPTVSTSRAGRASTAR